MRKIFHYRLLLIMFLLIGSICVNAQQNRITAEMTYDFQSGHIILDSFKPAAKKLKKDTSSKTPPLRIYGLKEGQGLAVRVTNINPLKYYAELNGTYQTLTATPPDITAISPEDYFGKLPQLASAKPLPAPKDKKSQPEVVSLNTDRAVGKIECIKSHYERIEQIKSEINQLAEVFKNFNEYYEQLKTSDQVDEAYHITALDATVAGVNTVIDQDNIFGVAIRERYGLSTKRIEEMKKASLKELDSAINRMNRCYDELFEMMLVDNHLRAALADHYNNHASVSNIENILLQLPATRKEFSTVQEKASAIRDAVRDKVWPDIAKSVNAYLFCLNLNFSFSAGTFMVDEDIMTLNLVIKKTADNKEVRKVERIKIYTTGGFRVDYGAGLYCSWLGNDEFVTDRSTRIEKVATLTSDNTIDSVLQNVNYSTIRQSNSRKMSWGAMSYFQGRTNWAGGINMGGYFGIGLLLNDDTRPIFSFGGTITLGRAQKMNIHAGVVFGKTDRLNPKYETGKEYKGDLTEISVSKTSSAFLVGMSWNIGSIGKK